ncbi:MAG: cupin domain-containing protein [Bacteroidota bacterium]|nr:cupin domain-containing protein [Bacteroidota bacterium]
MTNKNKKRLDQEKIIVGDIIKKFTMQPHPEGGWYTETYRSQGIHPNDFMQQFPAGMNYSTAIYYLLERGQYSTFHKIKSDEMWHHYSGEDLHIHCLDPQSGNYELKVLGSLYSANNNAQPQHWVPANVWFASEPAPTAEYVLTGCTVSPGFNFSCFEIAKRQDLIRTFAEHTALITRLTQT